MVGPRVFTVDEANALVPDLERAFASLDALRDRMRTEKVKLNALEMIWSSHIQDEDCPDHVEAVALVDQLKHTQEEVAQKVQDIGQLGATVKDVQAGLADVYHVREGRLVFLCWKRGESEITEWHHVDEGFAERQPL